jgi:hypothetical protein
LRQAVVPRGAGVTPGHEADVVKKVLFLCSANSARSQMAEALLRALAGDAFESHSAGTAPRELHPLAIVVMAERGIDIADQRPPYDWALTHGQIGLSQDAR